MSEQPNPNKEYAFNLTMEEARVIVMGLKKFPMEQIEGLISKMELQFKAQQPVEEVQGKDVTKEDAEKASVVKKVRTPRKLKQVVRL